MWACRPLNGRGGKRWFPSRAVEYFNELRAALAEIDTDDDRRLTPEEFARASAQVGSYPMCHFAVQLSHCIPGFLPYPVAVFLEW